MAESKETKTPSIAEVPATMEQVLALLAKTIEEGAKDRKELTAAILESRKPYVDPKVLLQKQADLEERRKMVQMVLRQRQATKAQCPHVRTNGDGTWDEKGRLNIKWQEHSQGIILGVCGTCQSQFDARNPKDMELLRRDSKAFKNMARARENTRLM